MINGNVNEFVSGLYFGDERWFIYNNIKYFIQGWVDNNVFVLMLDQMEPESQENGYLWLDKKPCEQKDEVVQNFLQSSLFDGKTFWEVEQEIEWVDC